MKSRDDPRSPGSASALSAEAAFEDWVDRVRTIGSADLEAWLAEQPVSIRDELRKMAADFEALRAAATPSTTAFQAGRVLGDFRLTRELGRGGMAVVWEAEQESLGRTVALKILAPHHALSFRALERFEREARAGARLAHAGIVPTYSVGHAEGVHFIAQELVSSGYTLADSLADLADGVRPDDYFSGVAGLFAKVADALEHAHRQGVVHRDVKPSNILISESDEPRVADFGLASVGDELDLSQTGDLLGTAHYMSPEQAASKRIGIDHRSDVFSLGATLYEALTFTKAFPGASFHEVLERILVYDPEAPRKVDPAIPRDLAVICMKCLEKRRDWRYQSMAELADDLRRFEQDLPIHARGLGIVQRVARASRRHPLQVTALIGVLFVGGLALWVLDVDASGVLHTWLEAIGLIAMLKPLAKPAVGKLVGKALVVISAVLGLAFAVGLKRGAAQVAERRGRNRTLRGGPF